MNKRIVVSNTVEFTTKAGVRSVLSYRKDGFVELRYYDSLVKGRYRSWKMSGKMLPPLLAFWNMHRSGSSTIPSVMHADEGEMKMTSDKTVSLKESDEYGNLNMIGIDLPSDIVQSLCDEIPEARKADF